MYRSIPFYNQQQLPSLPPSPVQLKPKPKIPQNNTNPNSNGPVLSAYCSKVLGPQLPVPKP